LNGTILFSSISPDYERNLKEELYGCFKYIGIPLSELDRMPTRDRKSYIFLHNQAMEKERQEMENENNKSSSFDINEFARKSQGK
jgi:hypothetical protein